MTSSDRRCLTIIETPQVFNSRDVIDLISQLSRRCFDLILIGIKPQSGSDPDVEPVLRHEREVLVSLLQMLEGVYQENFWTKLAFVFLKDRGKIIICAQRFSSL